MFRNATLHVLQGLQQGLSANPLSLDIENLQLLLRVSEKVGLSEVAQQALNHLCYALCQHSPYMSGLADTSAGYDTVMARRYNALKARVEWVRSTSNQPAAEEVDSLNPFSAASSGTDKPLETFLHILHESDYQCLKRGGLLQAMRYISTYLDSVDPTCVDRRQLLEVLDAIWSEIEIQDYPKAPLLSAPELFLHPACVSVARRNSDVADFTARTMTALQRLSEGRVYVVASLAKAVKYAYLGSSKALSVLPIEDYVIRFAAEPSPARPEFLLESVAAGILEEFVPGISYASFYPEKEGYGYACIFDMLSRWRASDGAAGRQIINAILNPWENQKKPSVIVSKWKRTTQLQIILLLFDTCVGGCERPIMIEYLRRFNALLEIEPLPRYRFLLEWIITRPYMQDPTLFDSLYIREILEQQPTHDHPNPKYLPSVLKIGSILAGLPEASENFLLRVMTLTLPPMRKSEDRHNPAFDALNKHVVSMDKYSKPPPERLLLCFDPLKDHNLVKLCQGDYLRIEPPEADPATYDDFLSVLVDDLQMDEILFKDSKRPRLLYGLQTSRTITARAYRCGQNQRLAHFHSPNSHAVDLSISEPKRNTRSLILVAPVITTPQNLGGLSRCAEIFGAEALYIPSLSIMQHNLFLSVAVSSHLHLPILPVLPADLPAFLRSKQAEGWTVLGVEQTDQSKVLGREGTVLPERCVLVIGAEKTGISGVVLKECDLCVEIEQVGIMRSLNVQTAAATVLYEYGRLWGKDGVLSKRKNKGVIEKKEELQSPEAMYSWLSEFHLRS
ncbi:hypothetical protein LTS18_011759 [Coniosporium uncinatum]|uniref:Uncharacterized protein n=1 Tax=Coniosporium uncinatum TaxID=93489 RepID=A0ACC3DCE5_9PEZI|nr:hypothetical protein LTS18_011759 [Coniosporium uncinatum]